MVNFNRGEWSEFYAFLHLLITHELPVFDSSLNSTNDKYTNTKIYFDKFQNGYFQLNQNIVEIYSENSLIDQMDYTDILHYKSIILNKIVSAKANSGSFPIIEIEQIYNKFENLKSAKSNSNNKADITLEVMDPRNNTSKMLSYSIKSNLGSPPTLLNSSKHTNFIFSIQNITIQQMNVINSINSKTKLLDRIKKIDSFGGKILFEKAESSSFEKNLIKIDPNLPLYIAETLIYSYRHNSKEFLSAFEKSNNIGKKSTIKLASELLTAISFGMFPSAVWNGHFEVDGGFIVIRNDGEIGLLDLINNHLELFDYLGKETKLDSPSSKRYKMLELYNDSNRIFFKLNLQIRFK